VAVAINAHDVSTRSTTTDEMQWEGEGRRGLEGWFKRQTELHAARKFYDTVVSLARGA
jgi:hypothetical protein